MAWASKDKHEFWGFKKIENDSMVFQETIFFELIKAFFNDYNIDPKNTLNIQIKGNSLLIKVETP